MTFTFFSPKVKNSSCNSLLITVSSVFGTTNMYNNNYHIKRDNTFRQHNMSVWALLSHKPSGRIMFPESFHAVPEISEFLPSAARVLPELRGQWEGKVVQGWSQSQRQARGQSIMKHTNTQLCVDSLPLFLPIHHNSSLIPLRSAHQGQTVPIQWRCRIWWNKTEE